MSHEYYMHITDDGEAIIRCVELNNEGMEIAFSEHSSKDESLADGDGSLCAPEWNGDLRLWSKVSREQAESCLAFELCPTSPKKRVD